MAGGEVARVLEELVLLDPLEMFGRANDGVERSGVSDWEIALDLWTHVRSLTSGGHARYSDYLPASRAASLGRVQCGLHLRRDLRVLRGSAESARWQRQTLERGEKFLDLVGPFLLAGGDARGVPH